MERVQSGRPLTRTVAGKLRRLEELARAADYPVYRAGDTIIEAGDSGETLFVVINGSVESGRVGTFFVPTRTRLQREGK